MKKKNELIDGLEENESDDNDFEGIDLIQTGQYIIKISTTQEITTTLVCQLEYLFSKSIGQLEEFRKIEIGGTGIIHITYFGDLSCLKSFTEKLKPSPFFIAEIVLIEETAIEM